MKEFQFITHDNFDAYFNLASEEYLLKQTDGYYFYLWINAPAVIVGVNQNTLQEVNLSYCNDNNIKVVRRLTGGGAVYHDNGNLCYTIIAPYEKGENHYQKFTAPVIDYLKTLGITANLSGRNDIEIDGKKISGNAQTVYKDRIMHHGTILFNADLTVLSKALNPSKLKVESKGIKSVRSRVANISEYLKTPMDINEFKKGLSNSILKSFSEYKLTETDLAKINALREEKYSTYEWNIGKSPKGKYTFEGKFPFGILIVNFDIENGKTLNTKIYGDFFSFNDITVLEQKLNGIEFNKESFSLALFDVNTYINGADKQQIIDKIFCD